MSYHKKIQFILIILGDQVSINILHFFAPHFQKKFKENNIVQNTYWNDTYLYLLRDYYFKIIETHYFI